MDDLFEHAMESERDKAINGYYTHFIVFLAVIAGLAIINLIEGEHFWVQWVVLGWGTGIAFHAYNVFIKRPREEQARREMMRLREERRNAAAGSAAPAAAAPEPGSEPSDSDPTRRM